MAELGFNEAFREAGGRHRREPVPYPLTHDYIRKACERRERLLRIQFETGRFEESDEQVLAVLPLDHPDKCWQRYQHLIGLWFAWERGGVRGVADAEAHAIARDLLHREPVIVRVAGRTVPITGRSRRAMIALARHERQRRALGQDMDRIETQLQERMPGRRRRRLLALAERIEDEWEFHFRGILASSLSPDGRAALPEDAPEYWEEVSAEDEVLILTALIDAGPGRFKKLGAPPRDPKAKPGPAPEFGFDSLFAFWEGRLQLEPATLNDTDLGQLLTWLRAGSQDGGAARDLERAFAA